MLVGRYINYSTLKCINMITIHVTKVLSNIYYTALNL